MGPAQCLWIILISELYKGLYAYDACKTFVEGVEICYTFYYGENITEWQLAKNICEANGETLLEINSPNIRDFLMQELSRHGLEDIDFWTSLNDKATEGIFEWDSGINYCWSAWKSASPSSGNCVVTSSVNTGFTFSDKACRGDHPFICQTVTPPEYNPCLHGGTCTPFTHLHSGLLGRSASQVECTCLSGVVGDYCQHDKRQCLDGTDFEVSGESICYWSTAATERCGEAFKYCFDSGGYLANLSNQTIISHISSTVTGFDDFFCGASSLHTQGVTRWSTGHIVTNLEHFEDMEIDHSKECTKFHQNHLKSERPTSTKKYLCQSYNPHFYQYNCDSLADGCLGIRQDTWTYYSHRCEGAASEEHEITNMEFIYSETRCKDLCQTRTDFNCRAYEYKPEEYCKHFTVENADPVDCPGVILALRTSEPVDDPLYASDVATTAEDFVCEEISSMPYTEQDLDTITTLLNGGEAWTPVYFDDDVDSWKYYDGTYPEWSGWPAHTGSNQCTKYKTDGDVGIVSCSETLRHVCKGYPVLPCLESPQHIENSTYHVNGTQAGDNVTYTCDECYHFDDCESVHMSTCQADGTWSQVNATCLEYPEPYCGSLPGFPSGYALVDEQRCHSIALLLCDEGWAFQDCANEHYTMCSSSGEWTMPQQYCERIECSAPTAMSNATVSYNTSFVGDMAVYECLPGYHILGTITNTTVTCLESGEWSPFVDMCQVIDCEAPDEVDNTTLYYNSTLLGDEATYECRAGHRFSDNNQTVRVRCMASMAWSQLNDFCSEALCEEPPNILYTNRSDTSRRIGDNVTYYCHDGWMFDDFSELQVAYCTEGLEWSNVGASCQVVDCGFPPMITDADAEYNSTLYGQTANYSCRHQHLFLPSQSSAASIACGALGDWVPEIHENCTYIDCEEPEHVHWSTNSYHDTGLGAITTYTCLPYHYIGSADFETEFNSTCRSDGQWSPTIQGCTHHCGNGFIGPNTNSSYDTSDYLRLIVHCGANYEFADGALEHVRTCNFTTREWSEYNASCYYTGESTLAQASTESMDASDNTALSTLLDITTPLTPHSVTQPAIETGIALQCDGFVETAHSQILEQYSLLGGHVTYICDVGYTLLQSSSAVAVCQENGQWHTEAVPCKPNNCPTLELVNANCEADTTTVGSSVKCTCEEHFLFYIGIPVMYLTCNRFNEWYPAVAGCAPGCGPSPHIENSHMELTIDGLHALYVCDTGYRFPNGRQEMAIACSDQLQWDEPQPCLINVCEPVTVPEYGSVNAATVVYGSVAEITCNLGYTFTPGVYSIFIECLEDATWNDTVPNCMPVQCEEAPYVSNSIQTGSDRSYMSSVNYVCELGFGMGPGMQMETIDVMRVENGHTNTTIFCQQNSQWSATLEHCEYGRCPPVPNIEHAWPNTTQATNATVVEYRCEQGYSFSSGVSTEVHCIDMHWEVEESRCGPLRCGEVPNIQNAMRNSSDRHYLAVTRIQCNLGYTFGPAIEDDWISIRCEASAHWSVISPTHIIQVPQACRLVTCSPAPVVPQASVAHVMPSSSAQLSPANTYGSSLVYACAHGYWFARGVFTFTTTCTAVGVWQPPPNERQCTRISCPPLPQWGGLVSSSRALAVGTQVNASCGSIEGQGKVEFADKVSVKYSMCNATGQWHPPLPACIASAKQVFHPEPTEAEYAQAMGAIGVVMMTFVAATLLLADAQLIYTWISSRSFS